MKNAREMILREYEETDIEKLPDERYQLKMKYYDNAQLIEERKCYDAQIRSFEIEVQHLWDVLEMTYEDSKFMKGIVDFKDLARKMRSKIKRKIKDLTGDPTYEDIDKVWDEVTFIRAGDTDVEKMNRTYIFEKNKLKKRLIMINNKLQSIYGYKYPIQRRVMEERLQFLEAEFNKFDYMINPYHIQPGLLLDVDITSIKKKKATLDGMANVLNEFLHGVSKGFQDAAFASFSRRRSTVREDIARSFATETSEPSKTESTGAAYLDMLNSPASDETLPAKTSAPRVGTRRSRGIVDSAKRSSSRGKKSGGRGLKEI
jgi:hypothetical protein